MGHPRYTILIAEDNLDEIFLMRRALARTGLPYELRFVPNGREAIDYLQRKPPYNNPDTFPPPAAIVLDIDMPQVGGFEVLQWLKNNPVLNSLPAVMHSISSEESERQKAAQLGAIGYFSKKTCAEELPEMFQAISRFEKPESTAGPVHHN